MTMFIVACCAARGVPSTGMFDFFKSRRRATLHKQPFPEAWRAIIAANTSYVSRLPGEDRIELEGHVQVFLAEKTFEGCGGLEITDEIRVTIAAQACLLLLHRETDYFPDLEAILVYPHTYVAKTSEYLGSGAAIAHEQARLGQSASGVVVLAWDGTLGA
jgi:Mlc titration factor MtfA (ptsG expression regulator)